MPPLTLYIWEEDGTWHGAVSEGAEPPVWAGQVKGIEPDCRQKIIEAASSTGYGKIEIKEVGRIQDVPLWSAKIRSSSDEMVFVMEAAEDGAGLHGIGLSAAMS